jgi:hypothetical protein
MKYRPTFFVSVRLWLHSYMRIWASSFSIQRMLRLYVWGPSGTLAEEQGSLELIGGTKGPFIRPRCNGKVRARTHMQINPSWWYHKPILSALDKSVLTAS